MENTNYNKTAHYVLLVVGKRASGIFTLRII